MFKKYKAKKVRRRIEDLETVREEICAQIAATSGLLSELRGIPWKSKNAKLNRTHAAEMQLGRQIKQASRVAEMERAEREKLKTLIGETQ